VSASVEGVDDDGDETDLSLATRRSIEAVWRLESSRLIAGLVSLTRDIALAEDLAQDALLAALEQWPDIGVPRNPGAWLTTIARRRAVDYFRRRAIGDRKTAELATELAASAGSGSDPEAYVPDFDATFTDRIDDDMLRLIFICCHPVLTQDSRVALKLRLLGGLTTPEIARAFLTSESTIGQRISRAKKTLAQARVPFEEPDADQRHERVPTVLSVLYLVFNEGYSATAGEDWIRPALCQEAIRLGRVLAALLPDEPAAHGLLALMELQASRLGARTAPDGTPILLLDQDRTRWDRLLIRRGLAALDRALALSEEPDAFVLQAAIAACHARARTADETDWARIALLYKELLLIDPSPVIELNRAVAVSMAAGPAAALPMVDTLVASGELAEYHLLPSVRGDLLARLGRSVEAQAEFRKAAELTNNERERALLLSRADSAPTRPSP